MGKLLNVSELGLRLNSPENVRILFDFLDSGHKLYVFSFDSFIFEMNLFSGLLYFVDLLRQVFRLDSEFLVFSVQLGLSVSLVVNVLRLLLKHAKKLFVYLSKCLVLRLLRSNLFLYVCSLALDFLNLGEYVRAGDLLLEIGNLSLKHLDLFFLLSNFI